MIKNRITLKQLEALVYVAQLRTFRKAATALGTTQPNISVRISSLEETLGVLLMRRDAGSVELTEKGKEMLAAAREVLRTTEVFLEVADRRDLIEEKLRLGVTEMVASTWLHQFLRQIKELYPSLSVELTVDLSRELQAMLQAGEMDLAVLTGPIRLKGLSAIPTNTNRYTWVTSAGIAAQLGTRPDFHSVFEKGLMSHGRDTLASKELDQFLTELGLPLERVAHCNSLTALLRMAADGLGVAVLPRKLLNTEPETSKLVEIECPWVPNPLEFFTCHDDKNQSGYIKAISRLAVEVAREW